MAFHAVCDDIHISISSLLIPLDLPNILWNPAASQRDFLRSQQIQHTIQHTEDCILDCSTKLAPPTFSSFSVTIPFLGQKPQDHFSSQTLI